MKLHHILLVLAASVTLTMAACKASDHEPPSVVINQPSESDVFVNGNTIHIQGVAEDRHGLSQVSIEVTMESNDSLLFEKTDNVSTAPYSITADYVVDVPDSSVIAVHLEATDEAGNTNDTHVHLTINN
jgi:DNA/RNA endonuclease YhcR with UshA esterase domain